MRSVKAMAAKIATLPDRKAKRRQAHKLCEALIQLLKVGPKGAGR